MSQAMSIGKRFMVSKMYNIYVEFEILEFTWSKPDCQKSTETNLFYLENCDEKDNLNTFIIMFAFTSFTSVSKQKWSNKKNPLISV